ncbi:hypothetical protein ACIPWF_00625 [Paenarthrobacter sp. NPDC089989]|uniref:hypothetical protein n=1 Tax=unclassified Paenarthrobacter TaxID=2634190 RepID=UPI00382180D2
MPVRRLRPLAPEAQPHIEAAGKMLAQATARLNSMTPQQIAEAAYRPGGPSMEQLLLLAEARQMGRDLRHTPPAEVA